MYVKEDLILPHHYTFYDFIVTKVRVKWLQDKEGVDIDTIKWILSLYC